MAGNSVKTQSPPSFQGPRVSISPWSLGASGVVEELIYEAGRGSDPPDAEGRFAHAIEGKCEGLHMGDFADHKELQDVLRAGVLSEVDQTFVDDLGPSSAAMLLRRSTSSSPVI
jgi:hypothetical protein